MGFLSKITKPVKKFVKKGFKISQQGLATSARLAGGYFGMPALGNQVGDYFEPGDTSARNAQKYEDLNYTRNLANQENFAKNSLSWRVADARRSGIHPLAALGFQGAQFQPINSYYQGDDAYAAAQMGQDLSRAINTVQNKKERQAAAAANAIYDAELLKRVRLENAGLEIDNLNKLSQFVRLREFGGQVAPSFPTTNAKADVVFPDKRTPLTEADMVALGLGPIHPQGTRKPPLAAELVQNLNGTYTWVPRGAPENLSDWVSESWTGAFDYFKNNTYYANNQALARRLAPYYNEARRYFYKKPPKGYTRGKDR